MIDNIVQDHCKEMKDFDTINTEALPESAKKKIPLVGNLQLVHVANSVGSRKNVNN